MASIFPRLTDAMQNEESQGKQSIFGDQGGGAPEQGAPVNTQAVKTSTVGEIDGAQGQGVGSGSQGVQQTKAEQQALGKAVGKTQNPALLQKTQGKIAEADQKLQDEANAYVQKAQNTNYGVDTAAIEKGLSGDDAAYGQVTGTLGKKLPDAGPAFKTTADLNQSDVDEFQTDKGIENMFRREGGAEYTAGMGKFDVAALRRTPGFENIRNSLTQSRSALQQKADEYSKSKSAEADKIQAENLKRAQGDITGYLTAQDQALRQQNIAEAQAATAAARAKAGPDQSQIDAVKGRLNITDPRLMQAYDEVGNVDAAPYWQAAPETTWEDMVDDSESQRFSRLLGAMGKGGTLPAAGKGAKSGTFNEQAYQDAVMQAVNAKRAAMDYQAQLAKTPGQEYGYGGTSNIGIDEILAGFNTPGASTVGAPQSAGSPWDLGSYGGKFGGLPEAPGVSNTSLFNTVASGGKIASEQAKAARDAAQNTINSASSSVKNDVNKSLKKLRL